MADQTKCILSVLGRLGMSMLGSSSRYLHETLIDRAGIFPFQIYFRPLIGQLFTSVLCFVVQ